MSKGAAIALAARMNEPLNEEIKSLTYELSTNANFVAAKQKYDNELSTKAINDANNAIVNSAT